MTESFPCDRCASVFQRREHLLRHVRTHTKERPFACTFCDQEFARLDALSRHHATIHRSQQERFDQDAHATKPKRVAKACVRCSSAKIRCDGAQPCRRCAQSQEDCFYKTSGKQRTSRKEGSQRPAKAPRLTPDEQSNTSSVIAVAPSVTTTNITEQQEELPTSAVLDTIIAASFPPSQPMVQSGQNQGLDISMGTLDAVGEDNNPFLLESFDFLDYCNGVFDGPSDAFPYLSGDHQPWSLILPPLEYPHEDDFGNAFTTNDTNAQEPRPETPIADCYSRVNSPPLDRDKIWLRNFESARTEGEKWLDFPDMSKFRPEELDAEDYAHVDAIDAARFQPVVDLAERLNNSSIYSQSVRPSAPPPGEVLNVFIQLYFEHFHRVFPILHPPTFSSPDTHPILLFTVAAIGAGFSKLRAAQRCSLVMHEMIRQQTPYLAEKTTNISRQPWLLQTIVLNFIGLMYSGDRRALQMAEIMQSFPVALARRSGLFEEKLSADKMAKLNLPQDRLWKLWTLDEARRRLAHAIWILDLNFNLHFDLCTSMTPGEIHNCLPQSDKLWSAPSAQAWANTASLLKTEPNPSINKFFETDNWRDTWSSMSTLGRQAVLLTQWHLATKTHENVSLKADTVPPPCPESTRAAQRLADIHLLLDQATTHHPSSPCSQELPMLKAMAHLAQAKHYSPLATFQYIVVRYIYSLLDESTVNNAIQRWKTSIPNSKRAVFHASCAMEIIQKFRHGHYSTPMMLFKAVLTLWCYSKFMLSTSDDPPGIGPPPKSILLGCDTTVELRDQWLSEQRVVAKIAGVGKIDSPASRIRLVEAAVSAMEMCPTWALGPGLSICLTRLRERESITEGASYTG